MMRKRIAFQTFGCKLNFSETSGIATALPESDYEVVDFNEAADFYVINSCTVTSNADKRTKQAINRVKKLNPNSKVTIMGCYSQNEPEEVAEFNGVDLVLGNDQKFNLRYYLENPHSERSVEIHRSNINKSSEFNSSYSGDDRTRTFLKVQDGCDYFCTFCTIPRARGRSRSDSIVNTVKIAQEIAQNDTKEIILSGVNIGDFGKLNGESFFDLIKALENIDGIERIRISSIEPELLSEEIIHHISKSKKILPHFHIPLQAGSNKVLKDMQRKYDTSIYTARVKLIKSLMPHACIAADVITGFPTESDEEFEKSYYYIKSLDISYMHIFTYSERDRTLAKRMPYEFDPKKKKSRSIKLHNLSDKKKRDFYNSNLGRTEKVLFEANIQDGMMSGWTENYIKVAAKHNPNLINTIQKVKLSKINSEGIFEIEL